MEKSIGLKRVNASIFKLISIQPPCSTFRYSCFVRSDDIRGKQDDGLATEADNMPDNTNSMKEDQASTL